MYCLLKKSNHSLLKTSKNSKRAALQGLIYTAGLMHNVLHALNIPLHVQEVKLYANALLQTCVVKKKQVIQAASHPDN